MQPSAKLSIATVSLSSALGLTSSTSIVIWKSRMWSQYTLWSLTPRKLWSFGEAPATVARIGSVPYLVGEIS